MKRWNIHIDHPWSEDVRNFGAPLRVYIATPWNFIEIALWPGHGAQVYDYKTRKYTDQYRWFVTRPKLKDN